MEAQLEILVQEPEFPGLGVRLESVLEFGVLGGVEGALGVGGEQGPEALEGFGLHAGSSWSRRSTHSASRRRNRVSLL